MYSSPTAITAGLNSETRIWISRAESGSSEMSRHLLSRSSYLGISSYNRFYGSVVRRRRFSQFGFQYARSEKPFPEAPA